MRKMVSTPWGIGLFIVVVLAGIGLLVGGVGRSAAQSLSNSEEQAIDYRVYLLAGTLETQEGVPNDVRSTLQEQGDAVRERSLGTVHALVQLYEIPTTEMKDALQQQGLELQEYLPNYAWMVALPADRTSQVLDLPQVRWAGLWTAEDKLHPNIRQGIWNDYAIHTTENMVMVIMQLHADAALEQGEALAEAHGGVALPPIEGVHGMTVWIPRENLAGLAGEEEVKWIEEGPAPLTLNNDGAISSMQVTPLYSAPYGLDGTGVRVFVFDGGTVLTTHNTFNSGSGSRVTMIDNAANVQDHPTHVAGTVAGDGDGGRAQGVAPGATILSAEYEQTGGTMLFWDNAGDIQADYALARNSYNADFGTNSIGSNTASNNYDCAREGDYGVSSNMLDGIVRGNNGIVGSAVLMTWANGNERTGGTTYPGRCGSNYLTTAPPSCAKNPIHIGAINSDYDTMTSFSSWGPCDDGRLKPILSAPGCELGRASGETYIYSSLSTSNTAYGGSGWCGTSMATPAAAGVVALMLEQWRLEGYGGANDRPLPALFKALLMHSARDLGQDGPDYIYGYGEVDAQAAVDLIINGNPLNGNGPENWGTGSVGPGGMNSYSITLPANVAELKVTLAWDDFAAAAYAAVALVNNLDLEVVAPDGSTYYYPWILNPAAPYQTATTGVNTRDNQEQVLINNPAAGTWTIRVKGTAVPQGAPQSYGLVYTARYPVYDAGACTEIVTNGGFETDASGWTLSGATRVAAPAVGHGSYSLRLGGANRASHTAYQQISIPASAIRSELSFWWYMTTTESTHPNDRFYVEVRNTANAVLATVDYRSDGWQAGQWMKSENLDLTPWVGQTIRLYFYVTTSNRNISTFWVDDISLQTCAAPLTIYWVGRNTDWNNASNWSSKAVPSCATNVVIPSPTLGGSYPTVNASVEVGNLTIQSEAQLGMSANTLGVCGNWDVQGTALFNATGGTVVFRGSSAQTINQAAGMNGQFYNLDIGNGSTTQTVTPGTNLDIDGSLTIASGATLSSGAYTYNVAGDWTRQGTFTPATSTFVFDGANFQTITGDTSFYNITVGSAVTLTTSSNVTLSGTLNNLGWTKETKSVSGIVSYGLANITVQVNTQGTLSTLVVARRDQDHPHANFNTQTGRYWRITPSGGDFSVTMTLPHDDLDYPQVSRYLGAGTWDFVSVSSTTSTVTRSGITAFSDWAAGNYSPDAVDVMAFYATPGVGKVAVNWETANEIDISGFNIYRSSSMEGEYVQVNADLIAARSVGSGGAMYSWIDEAVQAGSTYYYRLEILDAGGRAQFLDAIAIGEPLPPYVIHMPLVVRP
ncbi:MAG: S8 family serine peptidase [Anaerolineales bacterium]|nr:S8 family serine peptidase [Anaerolineales bacterium]